LAVVFFIAGAIVFLEALNAPGQPPGPADTSDEGIGAETAAADIQGVQGWINGAPLASLEDLRGKVVLLDFWTYSCVNCIRTLPYLRAWHEQYVDKGLVIIGVHSPEFAFEKSQENVEQAVQDLDVPWLVAVDSERATWDAFNVRAWPTKVLIGADGRERRRIIGEGRYQEMEELIRLALVEAGTDVPEPPSGLQDPNFEAYRGVTREIYGGWRWELLTAQPYIGNPEGAEFDTASSYTDPGPPRPNGVYFLHGVWQHQEEAIRHARMSPGYEDYIAVAYTGRVANIVARLEGEGQGPARVLVTLDGQPLTERNKGRDVVLEDGASYLIVQASRLYEVVAGEESGRYELRLHPETDAFALHTYTFGP
jgi:thiol-disulfide isomerase/thioredoxin